MIDSHPHTAPSRPFAAAPDPSRYFPATAIEDARQRIDRSIQRGEGPVLVIGAAGQGKTMLLEVVAQQFRSQLRSILLVGGQLCTRRALLQMILFQLDLPYREMDECELRLALLSYLQPQNADPRRILLLVDEADALPPRLLEELRVLTNLSAAGQLLVNLVLAGNSMLEEQFADPKLDLFSQRISARCYLSAFGRDETFHYVHAQVTASGSDPATLFTDDGLEAIFAATDGVPRLINQLGDQLLWTVAETGYSPLDGIIVQQSWSELQQLPAPWNTQSSEPVGVPVEYGELDSNVHEFEVSGIKVSDCDTDPGDIIVTEFDQSDYDEDGYSDEDEDLPASIPINATQSTELKTVAVDLTDAESTGSETFDVAQHLLQQLSDIDSAQMEPDTTETAADAAARNPFAEAFDSEEIILDRYSTFESLLLAEAPRAANRTDTAFGQQLQQFEATDTPTAENSPGVITDSARPGNFLIAVEEPSDSTFTPSDTTLDEIGDVLVIEECEQPETEIVNGQKFRQLFSSLETSGDEPSFG